MRVTLPRSYTYSVSSSLCCVMRRVACASMPAGPPLGTSSAPHSASTAAAAARPVCAYCQLDLRYVLALLQASATRGARRVEGERSRQPDSCAARSLLATDSAPGDAQPVAAAALAAAAPGLVPPRPAKSRDTRASSGSPPSTGCMLGSSSGTVSCVRSSSGPAPGTAALPRSPPKSAAASRSPRASGSSWPLNSRRATSGFSEHRESTPGLSSSSSRTDDPPWLARPNPDLMLIGTLTRRTLNYTSVD
mmetsp:Transcript_594/g.1613  ORF Transcript_594/g.1613 Transcript_594/m.1613 type:complete len:249 (-) Transcript_594:140-886(-)